MQPKRKFAIVNQNLGLTPMKKSQHGNFVISKIFYLNDRQTIFQGPFVQKHTKMIFPFFDQNHGLTPLRKNNMATV